METKSGADVKMIHSSTASRKKFECDSCKKSFTRNYSLKCHKNNVHTPNNHPSRSLKSSIPLLQPIKTLSKKKNKPRQEDKLRKYKRLVEDMRQKIKKERQTRKIKREQEREFESVSPEYKPSKKITVEWDESDGNKTIIVERLNRNQKAQGFFEEWNFKIMQGSITKMFKAPNPDSIEAFTYYMKKAV